jgi:hypothetical protein
MDIHIPTWFLWFAMFIFGHITGLAHAALNKATNN